MTLIVKWASCFVVKTKQSFKEAYSDNEKQELSEFVPTLIIVGG